MVVRLNTLSYFKLFFEHIVLGLLLLGPLRLLRILWRNIILFFHLLIGYKIWPNYNYREKHSGIPQPRFYNYFDDYSIWFALLRDAWANELKPNLLDRKHVKEIYNSGQYVELVEGNFPTRNSIYEGINIRKSWKYNFLN